MEADKEKGKASGQDWFWAKPPPPWEGDAAGRDAVVGTEEGGGERGRGAAAGQC